MSQHQIEWNAASNQWFCINCLRKSDRVSKQEAELELDAFKCIRPDPRRRSANNLNS
jgi:hypothetical protein